MTRRCVGSLAVLLFVGQAMTAWATGPSDLIFNRRLVKYSSEADAVLDFVTQLIPITTGGNNHDDVWADESTGIAVQTSATASTGGGPDSALVSTLMGDGIDEQFFMQVQAQSIISLAKTSATQIGDFIRVCGATSHPLTAADGITGHPSGTWEVRSPQGTWSSSEIHLQFKYGEIAPYVQGSYPKTAVSYNDVHYRYDFGNGKYFAADRSASGQLTLRYMQRYNYFGMDYYSPTTEYIPANNCSSVSRDLPMGVITVQQGAVNANVAPVAASSVTLKETEYGNQFLGCETDYYVWDDATGSFSGIAWMENVIYLGSTPPTF